MDLDDYDNVGCTFPGDFENRCTGGCAECPYSIGFCDDVGDSSDVQANYIQTKQTKDQP